MQSSWLSLSVYIIYFINFVSILITIYVERKKPINAIIWILVLTSMPIFGFGLYFLLGRNLRPNQKKIFKRKKAYDLLYKEWLKKQKLMLDGVVPESKDYIKDKKIIPYHDIIEMHTNASGSIFSQDNDIKVYTAAEEKYKALFQDIKNAKETIHILYYIIRKDFVGQELVNLLEEKAKEGIKVRLLYDHVGSFFTPVKMFKLLMAAGGEVYRFFPLSFGTYLRINYRNHRKIVVIDGKIGYTGGINIGKEYMGLDKKITPWRDTHIRITGTAVHSLQERFLMDWSYSSKSTDFNDEKIEDSFFPTPLETGGIGVQVVSSGPDSHGEQIKRGYMKMINTAKKSIYLQTPYFIPDEAFLESIQIAAMSGVDVRLIIPGVPDKKFVYRATSSYIKDVLDFGVKVYLYPGFIHSKMIVIDDIIASIGTTNLDVRSFALDFEVNIFAYDSKFSAECASIFKIDEEKSTLITRDWYNSRGLWIKFQEGLFRLASPLL